MERLAYRIPEAAAAVGVSRSTAYTLIAKRLWPVVMVGGVKRIPVEGLREWVRKQTRRRAV